MNGSLYNITYVHVCLETGRLMAGQWFSPGTLVSPTNKTDRYDITDIFLKVALNTIKHKLIRANIFLTNLINKLL